jgi:hypothetical protein
VENELDKHLAEVIGAFIGDGCLSKYYIKERREWREVLLFTGSWKNDSAYYEEVIQPIIEKNFEAKCELYHRKDDDTIRFRSYDKKIISFFLDLGFNFGSKTENVKIPDIIINDLMLAKAC